MNDWEGRPVPPGESSDQEITVWEISPPLNESGDYTWVRDYGKARDYAKSVIDELMDGISKHEEIIIKIRVVNMRLSEYQEGLDGSD